jgi:hypothetical protein
MNKNREYRPAFINSNDRSYSIESKANDAIDVIADMNKHFNIEKMKEEGLAKRYYLNVSTDFTGSALPFGIVEMYANGVLVGQVTAHDDGKWSMPHVLSVIKKLLLRQENEKFVMLQLKRYTPARVLVCKTSYKLSIDDAWRMNPLVSIYDDCHGDNPSCLKNTEKSDKYEQSHILMKGFRWIKTLFSVKVE